MPFCGRNQPQTTLVKGMNITDPVADIFGKDIAILIYFHAHREKISFVNREYKRRLTKIRSDGSIAFEEDSERGRFLFNYRDARNPYSYDQIARWYYLYDLHQAPPSLPKNYY